MSAIEARGVPKSAPLVPPNTHKATEIVQLDV